MRAFAVIFHLSLAFVLFGCGGSDSGTAPPPETPVERPNISYSPSSYLMDLGVAVTLSVVNTGGKSTSFTISPSLPSGLIFDQSSGTLSGAPTVQSSVYSYNVTASNATGSAQTQIQLGVRGPFYVTDNGTSGVSAEFAMGNTLYLGGGFHFVGPYRGHGGIVDRNTGAVVPGLGVPVIDGPVVASLPVPGAPGAYFIGGNFQNVGGSAIKYLAKIQANGAVDTSYNPNPNGPITAMHIDGTKLYVAGGFTTISGVSRSGLAKYETSTGAIDTSFLPPAIDAGKSIKTMAIAAVASLCIGGNFTQVGGMGRTGFSCLDSTSGAESGFDVVFTGGTATLNSMVYVSATDKLYVGGSFTSVDDPFQAAMPRNSLVEFDVTAGQVNATWAPSVTGGTATVNSILVQGANLYVGGNFTSLAGSTRNSAGAVTLAGTGTLDATFNPNIEGTVYTLGFTNNRVYYGGNITGVGGVYHSHVGSFDLLTSLTTSYAAGFSNTVRTVSFGNSRMFVGGDFSSFDMTARNYAAAIDMVTGQVMSWDPNADDEVTAITGTGATIYLGGSFTKMNGPTTRKGLAAVDYVSGTLQVFDPGQNGLQVKSLALAGNTLYVGGIFAAIGSVSQARSNVAAVDVTTSLATTFNPGANGLVNAIAYDSTLNVLYLGGSFSTAGNSASRNNAAAVSTAAAPWAATTWNPDPDAQVQAIRLNGTSVYLGGNFANLGVTPRLGLAEVTNVGIGTVTTLNANLNVAAQVYSIFADPVGNLMYIGGNFTTVNGNAIKGAAKLNLTTFAVDTAFAPNPAGSVKTIHVKDTTAFLGGIFDLLEKTPVSYRAGFAAVNATGVVQ